MLKVIQKTSIPILACLGFLALIGANGSAYADETATYQTRVKPALQITLPATSINLTVDPSNQPFDSTDFNISVATNSDAGYHMTMSSESTSLARMGDDTNTLSTLSANESGYTTDTFEANKWGYKIGAGNYIPFVSGDEIAHYDTTTNGDVTNLNFAAKVNYLQAAGTYHTVLEFFAVANIVINYIQDMDPNICTTLAPTTVVDIRDNEEYFVQRLADGNCWMLDNLRLDPTQVSLGYLKGNTNASDTTLTYLKNGGGSSPYPVDGVSSDWPSGSDRYLYPYVYVGDKDTVYSTTYGSGSGKFGVYYNECAASAGSHCYSSGGRLPTVKSDLCPAGWRLPIGDPNNAASNEFNNLYLAYGSDVAATLDAFSFTLSGRQIGGRPEGAGNYGYGRYWVSNSNGSTNMYMLFAKPSTFSVGSDYPDYGYNIRCIRDTHTLTDITYMQDIRPTVIRNTATGVSKTLIDKRDNEEYLVSKLEDGNIWMLDNLRLDPTTVSQIDLQYGSNATWYQARSLKSGNYARYDPSYPLSAVSTEWPTDENDETGYNAPLVYIAAKDDSASTSFGPGSGKVGVYYNFCAASAGSYCYDHDTAIGDAVHDICPASWRLPKGGDWQSDKNEFSNLATAYQTGTAIVEALGVTFAGAIKQGDIVWTGQGNYWASTFVTNQDMASTTMFPSGVMNLAGGNARYLGYSIRCIADF